VLTDAEESACNTSVLAFSRLKTAKTISKGAFFYKE